MLKIITILALVYCLSSTALPNSSDSYEGYHTQNKQPLPLKLADEASRNYYESGGKQIKPCPKQQNERNVDATNKELHPTPTYSARVVKYQDSISDNLRPQALSKEQKPYDSVLELYSIKNPKNKAVYQSYGDKDNENYSQKYKSLEGSNDDSDSSEFSGRNAAHEDSGKYGNQRYKPTNTDLDKSRFSKNDGTLDKAQSGLTAGNSNTKSESSKNYGYDKEKVAYNNNLQDHSKEVDESPLKSSNKFLTPAHFNDRQFHADNDGASYADNDEVLRETEDLFDKLINNRYYSDELKGKTNTFSDEATDALYGVLRNKADSDELNEALYEIRAHLAHSEELINALKVVGEKGKSYSNVLNDALDRVKKHKAQSFELDNDRNFERSGESDFEDADALNVGNLSAYSDDKYKQDNAFLKKTKSGLPSNTKYADSDENDRKCPFSKQKNLGAKQQKNQDATRRFLSESKEFGSESESLNSASNEGFSLEVNKNVKGQSSNKFASPSKDSVKTNLKKYYASEDDSQSAEDKEGADDRDNLSSSQTSVETKTGLNLLNPARGPGITSILTSGINLMDHQRLCYACSSAFDTQCYKPSPSTTRKFCRGGTDMCITKTYTDSNDRLVVIRDCGNDCSVGQKGSMVLGGYWNSCEVCDDDLCNEKSYEPNGAFSINSQSLVLTLVLIFAIKLTL